jgi:hypothetical protein
MIYDNYDTPKRSGRTDPAAIDIRKFLPESYQGSVIVTIRLSEVRIGHPIQVRKLCNMCNSLEILLTVSRRDELITGKNILDLI